LVTNSTSTTFQNMTLVLIFTFLSIAPFSILAGPGFFALDGWAWAAIFWTAIVCWVLPYYLWLEGLKHLSAATSTILLLSEIIIAVAASIVVLKEPVTLFSTIGAFLIVIAITLVSVRDKKSKIEKPENNKKQAFSSMLKLKYITNKYLGKGRNKKWQKS